MKNWITQRTTWLGIAAAVVAILGTINPEWATVATGVLSGAGLLLSDKKGL